MKNRKEIGIAALAVILTLGAGLGFYMAKSGAYRETFMPNTTINGIPVAGMGVEEVKALIEAELDGYELKIQERTGSGEVITREEAGLRTEFESGLEQILEIQEPMMWIKSLWTETDFRVGTLLVLDEEKLSERISTLTCMDPAQMKEPQDAYLSEYQYDSNSYEIIPQTGGTELLTDAVTAAIREALLNLEEEVDLDAAGCYTKAAITDENPELNALAAELNRYTGTTVTHQFGDQEEVLDGDTIHQWLVVDGTQVTLDESKVTAYVRAMAKKYNTAYGKRPFLTTYGDVVTVPGGSYGWRMDEPAEAKAILADLQEGAIRTREPQWLQRGASHGEYDYGNTYVEVNLTGQHLYFYKDGELVVECDFVSGNASKGWSTPAGIYPLTYKQRNATLRGEDYETPVSYWMPFNGNIGLHDASWRASFGGTIYKTNGSHGCVNLPPSAAKEIYAHISKGDPVICYQLEGTETKNTSGTKPAAQQTKPAETKPAETKPAETKPAETKPAETKPVETAPVETIPTETVPETTAPAETGANVALTPESSGALTETRPASEGPGGNTSQTTPTTAPTTAPGTTGPGAATNGPTVSETRPAGPGSAYGPGSQTGNVAGPGSTANGPGGPGSSTNP